MVNGHRSSLLDTEWVRNDTCAYFTLLFLCMYIFFFSLFYVWLPMISAFLYVMDIQLMYM